MTPKEIYTLIKERPYRDGEALISDFGRSVRYAAFEEVILFITEMENDGVSFPNDIKHKLRKLKKRME
jgi:hypothetical protein